MRGAEGRAMTGRGKALSSRWDGRRASGARQDRRRRFNPRRGLHPTDDLSMLSPISLKITILINETVRQLLRQTVSRSSSHLARHRLIRVQRRLLALHFQMTSMQLRRLQLLLGLLDEVGGKGMQRGTGRGSRLVRGTERMDLGGTGVVRKESTRRDGRQIRVLSVDFQSLYERTCRVDGRSCRGRGLTSRRCMDTRQSLRTRRLVGP